MFPCAGKKQMSQALDRGMLRIGWDCQYTATDGDSKTGKEVNKYNPSELGSRSFCSETSR